jgi:hypothetical protein
MSGTAKSHVAEQVCGDYVTGIAPSASRWVGLFSLAPTDVAGTGTELSGAGYARQPITFAAGVNQTPTGRLYTSNLAANFATDVTTNWGTLPEFGIFDAASAGNLLAHDALPGPPTVVIGQTFKLPAGSVTYLED